MSVLSTLPAPVVQMGLVEKIVDLAQNHPQAQQQAMQDSTLQSLKEQSVRVAEVDTAKEGRRVREREAGGNGRQSAGEEFPPPSEEEERAPGEADGDPRRTKPWAGYIVNKKI